MDLDFERRKKIFPSLLVAMLMCCKVINTSIAQFYSGGLQTGLLTMGAIWALFVYDMFMNRRDTFDIRGMAFMGLVTAFYVGSNMIYRGHIKELTMHYVEFCVLGFMMGSLDFDFEMASRYCCYILLALTVPCVTLIQRSLRTMGIVGMVESYVLLSTAMAVLSHAIFYRPKKLDIVYASYAVALYLIVQIMAKGTRGAVLCVGVLVLLTVLNLPQMRRNEGYQRDLLLLILVLVVMNLGTILTLLDGFLKSLDIEVEFISKTVRLGTASGDMSNGRGDIYEVALGDFISSPIWGKGIGSFPELHGMNYPHNMFLQVLAEGGLLLGIPIISLVIYVLYLLIYAKIPDRNYRDALIFLVSATIPAALASDELWNYPLLWLIFGIVVKQDITEPEQESVRRMTRTERKLAERGARRARRNQLVGRRRTQESGKGGET